MLSPVRFAAFAALLASSMGLAACAPTELPGGDEFADDIPLGDDPADEVKADGYGAATTCKKIPELPSLVDPRIIVSIDGLTLRLIDEASGFEKVFPIGPGAMQNGESRSMYPINNRDKNDFEIVLAEVNPCRVWWTDPETGAQSPVFAGLPFMRWDGPYAIHGPIDNYKADNGGNLRRGYVSHGCIRMEAADVLEVYGRIRKLKKVPVRVQREADRYADGRRVDLSKKWIGAECTTDEECNFDGGFCEANEIGGRGYCTKVCEGSCPDRAGTPETFCADLGDADGGRCLPKAVAINYECRPYDSMEPATMPRRGGAGGTASVCVPGSRGFVGDRCLETSDCKSGFECRDLGDGGVKVCTKACTGACPDIPGAPWTACTPDPDGEGSVCNRECTPGLGECANGLTCAPTTRVSNGKAIYACLPGDVAQQ